MKILKIELQNLNSLRSDVPMVIDFENEVFDNIGLFAITGTTGAGKTTILDAITIALYHSVPRFNKSNIKAGLEEVVSYGASEAMARVTFENQNEIFESHWSIRTYSKNGKKLTNPREEVRLKNLTTKKIISEKKRELQAEIEKITHLTYNQFLRSVMLAQGEFASFLSANAKDKGTLLEQITGEDIYKKIGETLNNRIFSERKILEDIKAKLNNEDLLSNEQKEELANESHDLTKNLIIYETEFKENEIIINWYKKESELSEELTEIDIKLENHEKENFKQKDIIDALKIHELAEPYKDLINNVSRIEKEILDKKQIYIDVRKEIEILTTSIDKKKSELESSKTNYSNSEIDLNNWLPKLDNITKLDTQINNISTNIKTLENKESELSSNIVAKEKIIKSKNDDLEISGKELFSIEKYLSENVDIPIIEPKLPDWNSQLTLKKELEKQISENSDASSKYKSELNKIDLELNKFKDEYENEKKLLVDIKTKLSDITISLDKSNINNLLKTQKELDNNKTKITEIRNIATEYSNLDLNTKKLTNQKSELDTSKLKFTNALVITTKDIETAERSLTDIEEMLEMERTIKSLDNERNLLVEGKPCALCGSTNHPEVEKYKDIKHSKREEEFTKRKQELESLKQKEKQQELEIAKLTSEIKSYINQIDTLTINKFKLLAKFNNIESKIEISDLENIENYILEINKKLSDISEKIEVSQKLQVNKDKLTTTFNSTNNAVNILNNNIIKNSETNKNLADLIRKKSSESKDLESKFSKINEKLNAEFSALNISEDDTNSKDFISILKNKVSSFHKKSKNLIETQSKISQINIDINHNKQLIKELQTEQNRTKEELTNFEESKKLLNSERNKILPNDITTNSKRVSLQKTLETNRKHYENLQITLEDLNSKKTAKTKEQELIVDEGKLKKIQLESFTSQLSTEIDNSYFNTRLEIEKSLLSQNDKIKYSEIKKNLEDTSIKLGTLKNLINKNISDLIKEKNFKISNEDISIKQLSTKTSKDELLKRSGEITKQIELDNQIKRRNKNVYDEITKQENELKKWTKLIAILGGSKHAFNTYVQRLTLQNLINLANIHLFKLNNRYSLKMNKTYKSGEELNFVLIDHFQTDKARPIDTSSGGEKFLISLALALGLSDLASRNVNIDSLFIDEGFGTLDSNTLETVISSLETLQSQGKMIGIISHVENLKERIPTQIQVTKKSNGVSEIRVV